MNTAGVVSFLGKLGKYLAEGVAVAAGVEPLVAPFLEVSQVQ